MNAIQLGFLNSIGYIPYVFFLLIGSRAADRGIIRAQLFIILFSLMVYSVAVIMFLNTPTLNLLILSYVTRPVIRAFSRTTVLAYTHEVYPDNPWRTMLLRRSLLTLIIEALILVLFSKLEFMIIIQYFAYFFKCFDIYGVFFTYCSKRAYY